LEQNEFSGAIVNTCGRIIVKLKSLGLHEVAVYLT